MLCNRHHQEIYSPHTRKFYYSHIAKQLPPGISVHFSFEKMSSAPIRQSLKPRHLPLLRSSSVKHASRQSQIVSHMVQSVGKEPDLAKILHLLLHSLFSRSFTQFNILIESQLIILKLARFQ